MRNLGFIVALIVAVIVGGLIGAFADFKGLDKATAATGGQIRQLMRQRQAPVFTRVAPDGDFDTRGSAGPLEFVIDTTRATGSSDSGGYYFGSSGSDYTPSTCRMPSVTGGAQVVVFGAYEGEAASTVALADRDMETRALTVEIEPGTRPLYLVLSGFRSVIWQFTGATERVAQVVLIASPTYPPTAYRAPEVSSRSPYPRRPFSGGIRMSRQESDPRPGRGVFAGVTGLGAARVATVRPEGCFGSFYEPESVQSARVRAVVRKATGLEPAVVAGAYSLTAVRLPSGLGAKSSRHGSPPPPRGFDRGMWTEATRFDPAGLADIDPATVVSSVSAQTYDILPNQMGLAQLLGDGSLQRMSDGLKIVKPITRFPAGLNGAHSTTFLLGSGVPMPGGSPGHSCVVLEATGEPVGESILCR